MPKSFRVSATIDGWADRKIANAVRDHLRAALQKDLPPAMIVNVVVGEITEDDPPQVEKGKTDAE